MEVFDMTMKGLKEKLSNNTMKDFYPFKVKQDDEGFILLELIEIQGRTLICWYNPNYDYISINLFNKILTNKLSRRQKASEWGYPTKYITEIQTTLEAYEIVGLYLKDMEKGNFWWELEDNLK